LNAENGCEWSSAYLRGATHGESIVALIEVTFFLMVWRKQATAKANAGILRYAQNDKSFELWGGKMSNDKGTCNRRSCDEGTHDVAESAFPRMSFFRESLI
jgi:hypothetical protein